MEEAYRYPPEVGDLVPDEPNLEIIHVYPVGPGCTLVDVKHRRTQATSDMHIFPSAGAKQSGRLVKKPAKARMIATTYIILWHPEQTAPTRIEFKLGLEKTAKWLEKCLTERGGWLLAQGKGYNLRYYERFELKEKVPPS